MSKSIQIFLATSALMLLGIANAEAFSVRGSKILDPNGREFIAKGVNVNGPGFGWPGDTPGYANDIIERWNFNSIRLNVRELDPAPYKYSENGSIDEIVKAYTSKRAVVVLEPHENTGSYFTDSQLDKLERWWRYQAKRYKNNPYVWFNVSNEPGGSDSSENVARWLNQNQRIINAIRDEGADNIIVVDGHYWGQDVGEWDSSPVESSKSAILGSSDRLKDPTGNLVFSVHFYDQWIYGDRKMADYFDRAKKAGIPLIIGEYGAMKDGKFKEAVSSMFNTAVPREIGRFVWAWWGGDDFELTTSDNGGGQHTRYDSQGVPTNLTQLGKLVWLDNHQGRGQRRQEYSSRRSSSSNLALHRPVKATAAQSGEEPSNAVDGNLETRWAAPRFPQEITIKVGGKEISKGELYPYQGRAYGFVVLADGKVIVDRRNNTDGGEKTGFSFPSIQPNEVKIVLTGCNAGFCSEEDWAAIREIKLLK